MKKFFVILVAYLKATLTVLKRGHISQRLKAMNADNCVPKMTVFHLIRIEARKSMYKAELAAKDAKVCAKIANTPMSFANRQGWELKVAQATHSPSGTHDLIILEYAEKWARLMELEMQQGRCLPEIMVDTADQAYTNDEMLVTFDFPVACKLLINFWKYGRELSLCYHD